MAAAVEMGTVTGLETHWDGRAGRVLTNRIWVWRKKPNQG